MCDIGRFDYHFVEADDRLPAAAGAGRRRASLQPVSWHDLLVEAARGGGRRPRRVAADALPRVRPCVDRGAGAVRPDRARASTDDGAERDRGLSWRVSAKDQPANTKFPVPAVDAPNVRGASDLGLSVAASANGAADLSALRAEVEAGRVGGLYVFDSGPPGSIGDVCWVIEARKSGQLKLLAVQGILMSDLARAADFVLPGASYVEKDACYTNEQGRVQVASQAVAPPGDAMEDWQILVNVAITLGVGLSYTSSAHSGRTSPPPCRTSLATRTYRGSRSRGRWSPARGFRRRTRPSAGSGTRCSRAHEGTQPPAGHALPNRVAPATTVAP